MHLRLLGRVRIECNGAIDLMRLDPMRVAGEHAERAALADFDRDAAALVVDVIRPRRSRDADTEKGAHGHEHESIHRITSYMMTARAFTIGSIDTGELAVRCTVSGE